MSEKYTIEKDIKIFCIKAQSFPEGIMDSHNKLKELIPEIPHRKFYGISYPVNGQIMYMTGVEDDSQDNLLAEKGCASFTVRAGEYVSTIVKDYEQNKKLITKAFDEMLTRTDIDPEGYCLEEYFEDEKDLRCSVPLKR